MDFRAALSAVLPPRRSDEPAGLRQDILDELADHLTCSYHRELLCGLNSTDARARTLERFGDPAAVARRLWLDAMKGRIMAKRVLLATCVMVTGASLALVGVFWMQSTRVAQELAVALRNAETQRMMAEQAAAEANLRLAETLARNQSTNSEILKQLQSLKTTTQSPSTPDWIPVSFKLTELTPVGSPAVGCEVQIGSGTNGFNKHDGSMQRLSDSSGVADFGVVRPGDWGFRIRRSWDENEHVWETTGSINVLPGSKVVKSIICPKAPPDFVSLRLNVDWPPDLAGKNLCVYTQAEYAGIRFEPPSQWTLSFNSNMGSGLLESKRILSGPEKRQAELREDSWQLWRVRDPKTFDDGRDSDQIYATLINPPRADSAKELIAFAPGTYRLLHLTVLRRRAQEDKGPFQGEGFEWIARAVRNLDESPNLDKVVGVVASPSDHSPQEYLPIESVDVPKSYWRTLVKSLPVKEDKADDWTISLPDELIKAVREKLKAEPAAKAKQ
jgi:hypothetical protein